TRGSHRSAGAWRDKWPKRKRATRNSTRGTPDTSAASARISRHPTRAGSPVRRSRCEAAWWRTSTRGRCATPPGPTGEPSRPPKSTRTTGRTIKSPAASTSASMPAVYRRYAEFDRRSSALGETAPRDEVAVVGGATRPRDGVDVGRLGPQRPGRAALGRAACERVELVMAHRVAMRDAGNHLFVETVEELGAALGRVGPGAVGVRVGTLPTDLVDVELVEQLHTDAIGDEAAQDPLAEELRRRQSLGTLVPHPTVVALERVLGPPQDI